MTQAVAEATASVPTAGQADLAGEVRLSLLGADFSFEARLGFRAVFFLPLVDFLLDAGICFLFASDAADAPC